MRGIVDPRATRESSPDLATRRGRQALSSSREIARRMNRAASALLPPSFWPSSCSSATHQVAEHPVERRRPLRGAGGERRLEAASTAPGRSRPRGPSPRSARGTRPAPRRPPARRWPSSAARSPAQPVASRRRPRRVAGRSPSVARLAGPRRRVALGRPRRRRHSGSRTLMWSSSQQRPSRQIASRARPSITKPQRCVGADRPLVEREHGQRDAVQPERPEGVVEHQLGRLGAVARGPRRPSRRS